MEEKESNIQGLLKILIENTKILRWTCKVITEFEDLFHIKELEVLTGSGVKYARTAFNVDRQSQDTL